MDFIPEIGRAGAQASTVSTGCSWRVGVKDPAQGETAHAFSEEGRVLVKYPFVFRETH